MPDEIQEMHKHAEEAHHDPGLAPVTISMAVLAVLLALVALLSHRSHTEELLLQTKASDQWAYYQAKNIRRHTNELFMDLLSVSEVKDAQKADKLREKYNHEAERYGKEQKEIEAEAQRLEKDEALERRRANRFDLGEVCLEAALVISSITLLTRRRVFWAVGAVAGLTGLAIAATGLLVQ